MGIQGPGRPARFWWTPLCVPGMFRSGLAALLSGELKPLLLCSSFPWLCGLLWWPIWFAESGRGVPSDCIWGPALSETINGCLTKQLEQLKTPVEPLSGAFGNLHLDSPPDESNVAPGSIPGETLAMGTCPWKCVCYGIGNFSTCVIARNQLTFLLLFLEKCQVYFFDSLLPLPWSYIQCAHRYWG